MSIRSSTRLDGKIGIIELRGALIDDHDTDTFRAAVADFIEQGNKCLIIDLHKVNYLNSSGIGCLLRAHSSYAKNNGHIRLVGLGSNVQNLMVITKLIDVFDIYDTMDEAIEGFFEMKLT